MKDIMPGVQIKIVEEPVGHAWAPAMVRFCGHIMTVTQANDTCVHVAEDTTALPSGDLHHWNWFPHMIERIIDDDPEFTPADTSEVLDFILGGD